MIETRWMGNHFKVEIKESKEELQHRLSRAVTASSKERLQMLYWLKTFIDRNQARISRKVREKRINSISLVESISQ